jgi:uncharacterized membrane protein
MNPRVRAALRLVVLIVVVAGLFLLFPSAVGFVEGAARSIQRLWWLILLIALAVWLIWAAGRRRE